MRGNWPVYGAESQVRILGLGNLQFTSFLLIHLIATGGPYAIYRHVTSGEASGRLKESQLWEFLYLFNPTLF